MQLQRHDSGFPSSRHGCMWSLMNILDYHQWHNVKKMLPQRKPTRGRRVKCSGSGKEALKNRENDERKKLLAEAEPLLVKEHSTETSSVKKRSRKSQRRASRAKEISKEEIHKRWINSFSVQSWLWKTSEVHDVESSDDFSETPYEKSTTEKTMSPENCMDYSTSQKPMRSNQFKNENYQDQFFDQIDLLELFKANKEFFLKFLQDPDVNRYQFPSLHKSNTKVRLTKSRSFPVADSSRARSVRPSTLKHKQNEIWSFPKGEKLSTRTPKLVTTESQEDLPEGYSQQGWNQLVMSRFKDIKQKLLHALQESKKANTPTSIDTFFSKDPSGGHSKELSEMPEMTIGEERIKIDDNLHKQTFHPVSRTSSLNESLDRYSLLFESSCRSEAKLHRSTSLKLKSEERVTSSEIVRKSTRRNLSLSDLDTLCSVLNGPVRDTSCSGIPVKKALHHKTSKENDSSIGPKSLNLHVDTSKSQRLEAILETEYHYSMEESNDTEDLHEFLFDPEQEEESRTLEQRDIGFTMSPEDEQAQPSESDILEPCSPDYTTSQAELSMLKELCSSTNSDEKTENEQKRVDGHLCKYVDKLDDLELNYVRDVLEMSGFLGNEYLGTWYSMDQPLDPSVFKDLEDRFQHELDFTGDWDHQLLFDLINETLIDIHETSYSYFPRALSLSGSKHRPMAKGQHLLEDVWRRMSSYLSFRPEMVQSLDDVVARDLAEGDWMNLQWDAECVALELEDLIFEELLDEVIYIVIATSSPPCT